MKRFGKLVSDGFVVVSLITCAAVFAPWVRSMTRCDRIMYTDAAGTEFELSTGPGRLAVSRMTQSLEMLELEGRPLGRWNVESERWGARHVFMSRGRLGGGTTIHVEVIAGWVAPPGGFAGFGWQTTPVSLRAFARRGVIPRGNSSPLYKRVVVPMWALAALFAVAPGARAVKVLCLRRHRRAGHCLACGYDLRATPDRCPECGTRVEAIADV